MPFNRSFNTDTPVNSDVSLHRRHVMNHLKYLLAAFCTLFTAFASAQAVHVSSEDEFTGRWKVLPLPIAQQPPESRADPFIKGECVYMLHERDGKWIPLTISKRMLLRRVPE
jgi:hypothetical protein